MIFSKQMNVNWIPLTISVSCSQIDQQIMINKYGILHGYIFNVKISKNEHFILGRKISMNNSQKRGI